MLINYIEFFLKAQTFIARQLHEAVEPQSLYTTRLQMCPLRCSLRLAREPEAVYSSSMNLEERVHQSKIVKAHILDVELVAFISSS